MTADPVDFLAIVPAAWNQPRQLPPPCRRQTLAPERLREHLLVEREVDGEALQRGVLVLELPDPSHLVDTEVPVALLPDVERGLTDAELPTDIPGGRPRFCLAHGITRPAPPRTSTASSGASPPA
jgi:hypothetical protein